MTDYIFCKIAKREIPAEIIYEDKKIVAFFDINPVSDGHTLVIPKEHHKMMGETPDELIEYIFKKSKELMKKIKKATSADYVAVSVIGVDVPHFHIHLIPRYHNDGLASFWPTKKFDKEKSREIINKIKSSD